MTGKTTRVGKVGVTTNGCRVLFGGNQILKKVDYDDNYKTL